MTKAMTLYVTRYGGTMFNTIGHTQDWSDTPLTKQGEKGVYHLGLSLKDISFKETYSNDSGCTMQAAQIILREHQNHQGIPYLTDEQIREWCFGPLNGGYDSKLWDVVPRILALKSYEDMVTTKITYHELTSAIIEADTTDWSEPYEVIRDRVWSDFEDIVHHREGNDGDKVIVVSHGLTISFLLSLVDTNLPIQMALENGSVTTLTYGKGVFTVQGINDTSYIEKGKEIAEERR